MSDEPTPEASPEWVRRALEQVEQMQRRRTRKPGAEMSEPALRVGDIISLGNHWSVPPDLVGKFWRVATIDERGTRLDGPFEDAAATVRYHPVRPAK